ncbi:MAG: CHAT domain-containing protein [Oscillochloris sp.]|nr:CHAT domain-containing protein [Oscillochloris sp.]
MRAQRFAVELWLDSGRRFEPEIIQLHDYEDLISDDPAAIAAHGLDLFNRLFVGQMNIAFQQALAAAAARNRRIRLRLALDAHAPLLHAIPWELLHFDDSGGTSPPRPLAVDPRIDFSRYIELADYDDGQPVAHRPVRMLTVISSPRDLARWPNLGALDKEAEIRDLRTRFGPIVGSGQFRQDFLPVASAEALERALADGCLPNEKPQERGYDVLLYYGHALHHTDAGSRLVLEDSASGAVRLYSGNSLISEIKNLPESHRPAMVVLVACNSAAMAGTTSLNSLGARLVLDAGIPAVLAMQRFIEIPIARAFTYHLSEHLLRDGLIDYAVANARRRVFQDDSTSWSTPVLYMRHRDGRLFTPNAQLDYVEQILRDPEILRWRGAEFINLGVLAIAPGQDWKLLRYRPEDAPAAVDVLEAVDRGLGLEAEHVLKRREARGQHVTSNLVSLVGPPHSGQTTILKRLCYDFAERVTRDLQQPPGLLISLTGYEQQRGSYRLEQHIIEMARIISPALGDRLTELFRPGNNVQSDQDPPCFVFLLDELDSLPDSARASAARELDGLARRLPEQRFMVAATQERYPGHLLANAQVLMIQPLNERRILRYLHNRDQRNAAKIYQQILDSRLLTLASDPSLLAMIYDRLAPDPLAIVTRNQLAQEYLDRRLSGVNQRYNLSDASRESLMELAWDARWKHREQIPLNELFQVLSQVRRDRDYNLEELYTLLIEARLLTSVGRHAARFVNPALHAYCAAQALTSRGDIADRLSDIITLSASPERLSWWEDVLYFYAGLASDPVPLFELLAAAIRGGSHTHALIAARCLESVPPETETRLPESLRLELLDACVLRLRSNREPLAERREQIVAALGRLSYIQVRHELRRILVEPVRSTSNGPRYEYTNVRIAAARALRNIYAAPPAPPKPKNPADTQSLVLTDHADEAGLLGSASGPPIQMPSMAEIRDDQILVRLMRVWQKGAAGRDEFLDLLRNSPYTPERALAAFAIGDMADNEDMRLYDAKQLLRVIVSPTDDGTESLSEEWQDTMWAAADALTLFEPDQVIPLLSVIVRRDKPISAPAAQQIAYIAGRVRAASDEVVDWLIRQLITHPSQAVKAKALQSLAWLGGDIPTRRLRRSDGRPGMSIKEVVQRIAEWQPIKDLEAGDFNVSLRNSDNGQSPLYLRRKAIEALAWIGDAATLMALNDKIQSWPIELREYWYQSAATIKQRMGQLRKGTR